MGDREVKDLCSGILQNMRVRVLFFGVLKEIFGRESEVLEMQEGARVKDLTMLLEGRAGQNEELMRSIAVAINQEYAAAEDVLQDRDEVALLPPVSGGLR